MLGGYLKLAPEEDLFSHGQGCMSRHRASTLSCLTLGGDSFSDRCLSRKGYPVQATAPLVAELLFDLFHGRDYSWLRSRVIVQLSLMFRVHGLILSWLKIWGGLFSSVEIQRPIIQSLSCDSS